jgi:DinB superfamily
MHIENPEATMNASACLPNRRNFLKLGAAVASGVSGLALFSRPAVSQESDAWVIGPKPGYTPEIGTLVSMMAFTRMQVLHNTKGMSVGDLDFLIDGKANTIGALLLHLAATDAYYHLNSFQGIAWEKFPDAAKQRWDVPMNLGEPARKAIKGNNLDYYLNALNETREKTLAELKKRDDKWLATVDTEAGMNNYGKWFHVAEHESNHDGQIKFLKSRLPGAKPASG